MQSTGNLIDSTIVEGVFTIPYIDRTMVANERSVILKEVIAGDRRVILVEASSGEILVDRVTGERQSSALDFALDAEGRLYLLYAGPPAGVAVSALCPILTDENRYVRYSGLLALQRIGTPEAQSVLVDELLAARWCPITTKDTPY